MKCGELNKKCNGRIGNDKFLLGPTFEGIGENFIDQSIYQNDGALYIPQEDWEH